MQFWMAARLSTDWLSAAPLVGLLSATAPQLVIEIEFMRLRQRQPSGFSTSTESTS